MFAESYDGPDLAMLREGWTASIAKILDQATLQMPEDAWMASGGKAGRHSEHLGYLVAEMQYLQRAHPGATW